MSLRDPSLYANEPTLAGIVGADLDSDDVVDIAGVNVAELTVVIQPLRRGGNRWVWSTSQAPAGASIRFTTAPSTDINRFGDAVTNTLALRPYTPALDGDGRAGLGVTEQTGDLGALVRRAGLTPGGRGLKPLTNAWVAFGEQRLTRVRDPFTNIGIRLAAQPRTNVATLQVRLPWLVNRIPADVKVFFERRDWVRAQTAVIGADGPWVTEQAAGFLPRDMATGEPIVLPRRVLTEVPLDSDGDLATGTGPRYVIDALGKALVVTLDGGGAVQAFNVR